jgi:hypothetical protein
MELEHLLGFAGMKPGVNDNTKSRARSWYGPVELH